MATKPGWKSWTGGVPTVVDEKVRFDSAWRPSSSDSQVRTARPSDKCTKPMASTMLTASACGATGD